MFLALPSDFMMLSSSTLMQVTHVKGNIYSTASPYSHAHPLPEWPQRSHNLNPNTAKYEDMNQFHWVSNDLLHMMLVSTWKPFYGPLFEHLSLPDYTIPTQSVFEEAKGTWQRIDNAAKHAVPGRKGARVFYWDEEDGFLIRQAAGQKNYDWHWGQFSAKQCRYNSFRNEWDLCEELDPQDEPTHIYMSDDDNSDYDGEDHYFPLDNDNDEVPDQDEGLYSSSADLECVLGIELIHQTEPKDFSAPVERPQDALNDVMYCRFGFTAPIVAVPKPSTVLEMHHVHKFVGMLQDTGVSHTTREVMMSFFGYLLQARNILDIPHELYDLRQHDADIHSPAAVR
ncbi:hypothetical protein EDD18DRAFT_1354677 [Armillaria luteobubalina]|uniref:Uncharacterized protein n=1 Tax=Armillaria luteobubalina TaxID=153913 RepID=A0AA39UW40_9AGAR|nr:hypothetical protein EDD18DRAFT_1354677 [Armillaria luteobubalina]